MDVFICNIRGAQSHALSWVSRVDWVLGVQNVKKQCTHAVKIGAVFPFTRVYECNWDYLSHVLYSTRI
jgi:hypothetical protein